MNTILQDCTFICHPTHKSESYSHPWQGNSEALRNSRRFDLPERGGICTFVRDINVKKPLTSAKITATALGIYELFIDGGRIGCDELKPGWTDYTDRIYTDTYDITTYLSEGHNRLAAEVSNGWWSGRISFGVYGFRKVAFICRVELAYADGEIEYIDTDADWRVTSDGRVRTADIWDGIYFDARRPDPRISDTGCEFTAAVPFEDKVGAVMERSGPCIRVRKELKMRPTSAVLYQGVDDDGSDFGRIHIIERHVGTDCEKLKLAPGQTLLLDMGQNMVGRPRLSFDAPKNCTLRVYFAEMLNDSGSRSRNSDGPAGSAYIENYRSAMARIVYVADGSKVDFAPRHTFFGFRYLELTADDECEIDFARGEVISSNLRETSYFECSDAEVNKLYNNILWGERGNYLSVPTDCPQRDERLGWTGDTQIFVGAGSYLSDIRDFMRKWMTDARDSQKKSGGYKDVIPNVFPDAKGASSGWGDAGIIVPYHMYLKYNDIELLREHYASMEIYMNTLDASGGPEPVYGDWLNYDVTDKRYISDCYYIYDVSLMEKFSNILSKLSGDFYDNRASHYAEQRSQLLTSYAEKYIEGDDLKIKTQTAYLMALHYNLVPEKIRPSLISKLEAKIKNNNYTLSTGFLGTGILNQTLSDVGLDKLCYSLLLQTADPSWLYSVRQGATTIWERWNSYTVDKGFGDVGMNSFNHYAYGAVAEWMFGRMAGISPDEAHPGFDRFILCPRPDTREDSEIPAGQKRITYVKAAYDSRRGHIESAWEWQSDTFVYSCSIPEDTFARVELPLLNGRKTVVVNGLVFNATELGGEVKDGCAVFTLGEGKYIIK